MSYDKTTRRIHESEAACAGGATLAIRWLSPGATRPVEFLEQGQAGIGRGTENSIHLDAAGVSRRHAEIERKDAGFLLRDLESTNGTFVNGQRIVEAVVSSGDVLRFGDVIGLVGRVDVNDPTASAPVELGGTVFGPGLLHELKTLRRVAPSDLPVVIVGPTGVGKECIARAIHKLSGRAGVFQAVNCAALPPALAEAELFGYRKGAFTGAEQPALGHFRAADGGTLLLDELADLPLPVQAKLLRVLQDGQVTPLGEARPIAVNVRVLAACQEPLPALVVSKRLREDLAARIAGLVVRVPPLSERRADVALLFAHFLKRYSGGRTHVVEPRLLEQLLLYAWPKNVRELELLTRQLLVLHGEEPLLKREFLPDALLAGTSLLPPPAGESGDPKNERDLQLLAVELRRNGGNLMRAAKAVGISRGRAYRLLGDRNVEQFLGEWERRAGR